MHHCQLVTPKKNKTRAQKNQEVPENPKVLINYVSSLKCLFSLMSGTRFTEWNMFAANSAAAEHTAEPSAALFSILKDHRGYALWIWVVSEGLWAGHGWTQQQRLMIGGEEEMAAFCCRDSKAKWSRKKKKHRGKEGEEEDRSMFPVAKSRKE